MGSSGGSGKDTVADLIRQMTGGETFDDYQVTSLGRGIYDICDNVVDNRNYGRHELQALGESMREIFGELVWIRKTEKTIREIENQGQNAIIADIRKLLEYSFFVNEKGFLPLYVKTDSDIARERLRSRDGSFSEKDLQNPIEKQLCFIEDLSYEIIDETGLMKVIDDNNGSFKDLYIIDNNGSLERTKEQVEGWLEYNGLV